MRLTLAAFNARYTHSCLGLFHVRNELESRCPGVVDFLQLTVNDPYFETILRITATEPDVIFFSAVVWNSDLVERLIVDLTGSLPACRFVVGGPQADVVGKNLQLDNCTVVSGPIETVDDRFYQDLMASSLRPRYEGRFLPQKGYRFVSPYRDSDFDSHLRNRHVYYETSRGCPFSCTYCLSSTQQGILHKDLALVKKELEHILSHGPAVVRFVDRTFNDRPERALAIWKFLAERKAGTRYHFEISPDRFSVEMFDFLRRVPVGLFQFEIGIQSTNPQTLTAVKRPMDIEGALAVVAELASLGTVFLHVDLILGLPFETEKSFYDSFAAVFNTSAHYIQMGLLKLLPDTPIRRTAGDHGSRFCRRPPYSLLSNRWLDHQKLRALYWFCEGVERFVNTRYFVNLWAYLRRTGEDIARFFSELLAHCHSLSFFERAPTQELLTEMLVAFTAIRDDGLLIAELLRFDWLRCGHRFLPQCLMTGGEMASFSAEKKRLFPLLPECLEGVYADGEKARFCKSGLFRVFSKQAMVELGYADGGRSGCLCFLPEKDSDLWKSNRVVYLPFTC